MSAIATITAFDGASTPVVHNLLPISVTKSKDGVVVAEWREMLTTVPAYAQVRASLKLEFLQKASVFRTEFKSVFPVLESVSGQNAAGYTAAPKVAYENTNTTAGYFHQRSTISDRRLSRQFHVNVLGAISTTVTPVTTGPVPELIDQLVAPT